MSLISVEDGGVPLVLFSGGLDSTYLLFHALRAYECVDVVSMELTLQHEKNKREKLAREKIITSMKRVTKNDKLYGRISIIHDDVPVPGYNHGNVHLGQPSLWMLAAMCSVTPQTSVIYHGIVNSDNCSVMMDSVSNAWNAIQKASRCTGFNGELIKYEAPLVFCDKKELLITEALWPVYRHISWCESHSKGNDCGICKSCHVMANTASFFKTFRPSIYDLFPFKARLEKLMTKVKKYYSDHYNMDKFSK